MENRGSGVSLLHCNSKIDGYAEVWTHLFPAELTLAGHVGCQNVCAR